MTLREKLLDKRTMVLGTFTLALLLRLIFVFQWSGTPYAEAPLLDAKCYDDWAQAIASGEIFRSTAFYQSPLFPYILALIYRVFGHNLLVVGLFNALLGAGTAALLTSLTLTYFGRRPNLNKFMSHNVLHEAVERSMLYKSIMQVTNIYIKQTEAQ